jgi:predicted alpha/beta hydrolase family esterase
LSDSLQRTLGTEYEINIPQMPKPNAPEYTLWRDEVARQLAAYDGSIILVGHSLGGSVLLKYLSEETVVKPSEALFLAAMPFWGAEDWDVDEYKLSEGFATHLPKDLPIFLYQCRDDEVVSYTHLAMYAAKLPQATVREFDVGGHQFNDDLSAIARDIQSSVS